MNIIEAKTRVLETLSPLGVPVWEDERGKESESYILYTCIYSDETHYADDEAQSEFHYFFVYFYTHKKLFDSIDGVMIKIKEAMKSAGFTPKAQNKHTVEDVQSKYIGKYSEFQI